MGLQVDLTLDRPLVDPLPSPLRRLARVSGAELSIPGAERVPWAAVLDAVERTGARPAPGVPVGLYVVDAPPFGAPGADYAGALLRGARGVPASNPPEDYEPRLPDPCRGHLRWGLPLQVPREPAAKGVLDVGLETVVTRAVGRLLGAGEAGEVVRADGTPTRFVRFRPSDRRPVLDPACLQRGTCSLCGTPVETPILPVARVDAAPITATCTPLEPTGHLGLGCPIVVPPALAEQLWALLGRDEVHLVPIHRGESSVAAVARAVLARVRDWKPVRG